MRRSPYTRAGIVFALLITVLLGLYFIAQQQKRPQSGTTPTSREAANSKPATVEALAHSELEREDMVSPSRSELVSPSAAQAIQKEKQPIPTYVTKADTPEPLVLPDRFLDSILDADRKNARIPLPGGGSAQGIVTLVDDDKQGAVRISGRITAPHPGTFYFLRQPLPNLAGSLTGHVLFDQEDVAYRIFPSGTNRSPRLHQVTVDSVVCRQLPARGEREEAPQNHPAPGTVPIPPSQNGIPPLQSLPGASAVVYLDFDGESGVFPGWNNDKAINAATSGMSNTTIFEAWRRIAEDYLPFNVNITTIRSVFEAAPVTSRMHCIITPTDTAAQGAGGVAYVGSFDSNDSEKVCWVFELGGKSCAEAASHEIGHTLDLSHDGRTSPSEGYYGGHGSGNVGWAPIMGVGYYENLSQWSKGEYLNANQTQDDLSIISNNNNNVDYRVDDASATYATAPYLDIASGGTVASGTGLNEGIIETRNDVDAFRFNTTGGTANLTISPANAGPNLDILAEIVNQPDGTVVASSNPDTGINATFNTNLPAGDYILRISGVGRGDVLGDGYSDYGSLGAYLISGTITGGVHRDGFTLAENTPNGTVVGTINPRASHGTGTLNYSISSGNTNGAFSINSSTGVISVAKSSELNYEALSTKWDDPAIFELFISITDSNSTAVESIRAVVTITNVNELTALPAIAPVTLDETTAIGTTIATVTTTDPDRFDYITYSIASGNTGGSFTINDQGVIKTAASLVGTSTFQLSVQATDHLSPANSVTTILTVTTTRFEAIPPNTGVVLEPNITPPGTGPYTYAWTKISGPGNVTFGNASAGISTAIFSANGLYQVRLTINNSSATITDDIMINAGAAVATFNPTGINFGTVSNSSYNYSSGTGTYTISGASNGIDSNGSSDSFQCYGQSFSGNFDLKAKINSATDITNSSSERVGMIVRSGSASNGVSAFVGFDSTPTRWVYWLRRTSVGANNSVTYLSKNWPDNSASWVRIVRNGSTVQGFYGSDGVNWTASATMDIPGEVTAGLCWSSDSTTSGTATFTNVSLTNATPSYNIGALVNAGPDQSNIASLSAPLHGTISDDGKPIAAAVSTTWSQVSGPGTISFGNTTQVDTTATASIPGIYTLRLIVNDSEVKTFDDVVVQFASPWTTWQSTQFAADASNPLISGDLADPDQDGIPNLLEYAFNTNPKGKDSSSLTQSMEEVSNEKYLRLAVTKNPNATDLTYTFESSGDLSQPSWTNPANTVTIESNTPNQIIGRDNSPLSTSPQRFLRLKVIRN